MAVLSRRNRLVSVRLSDEEFEVVRRGCELNGARSFSDFVRTALLDYADMSSDTRSPGQDGLVLLGDDLAQLDGVLKNLSGTIARVLKGRNFRT